MRTMKDIVTWAQRHEGEHGLSVEMREESYGTRVSVRLARTLTARAGDGTEYDLTLREIAVWGYLPNYNRRNVWKFTGGHIYHFGADSEHLTSPTRAFWNLKSMFDFA